MSTSNAAVPTLAALVITERTDLAELATAIGPHADRGFALDVREALIAGGFCWQQVQEVPRDSWLRALDYAAAQTWRRKA